MSTNSGEMMTASQMLTAKRLKGELQKLEKEREAYYQVVQDEKDPLLFYFLLRGASDSVYKGGYYIGKIVLPKDYPTNPGDFYMLTPSGRFNVNSKICLTNSGYHKESWTPMWNISNMVIGFVSVFLSDTTSGISHIQETPAERKAKAANSMQYNLANHKDICSRFDQYVKPDGTVRTDKEVEEFVQEKVGKFKKVKKEKAAEGAKDDTVKVVKKVVAKTETKPETKVDVKADVKEAKVEAAIAEKPAEKGNKKAQAKAVAKEEEEDVVEAEEVEEVDEEPAKPKAKAAAKPVAKPVAKKEVVKKVEEDEEEEEEDIPVKKVVEKLKPGKAEAKVEPKVEAKVDVKPAPATKPGVKTAVTKVETKVEPKVEAKAEAKIEAKPEGKQETKTKTVAKTVKEEQRDEDESESEDEDEKSITIGKKSDTPAPQVAVSKKSTTAKKDVKNADVDEVMKDVAKDVAAKDVKKDMKKDTKKGAPVVSVGKEDASNTKATSGQTIKVIKKTVANQPKSYEEWKRMIAESTVKTHDPRLFGMMF